MTTPMEGESGVETRDAAEDSDGICDGDGAIDATDEVRWRLICDRGFSGR